MDALKHGGSYVYGVYHGSQWTVTHSRARAERLAREKHGYVVRNRYQRGESWDSITFAIIGEIIADFRPSTTLPSVRA